MFGQNPVRKQDLTSAETLYVQEVFGTIQGEGPLAGQPAVFVRLWGCNLKCWFCDTDFESKKNPYTPEGLLEVIERHMDTVKTDLIVLTGGEPLRQDLTNFLYLAMHHKGLRVQIETAGTLYQPALGQWRGSGLSIVVSPKTGKIQEQLAPLITAYKYIISSQEPYDATDGLPMVSTQVRGRTMRLARPFEQNARFPIPVYLQPMDQYDEGQNVANLKEAAARCMRYGYRLSVQTHKLAGLP